MRFMMLGKATKDSEAGVLPSPEELAEMGKYFESLVNAGVLLEWAGLHASSQGARVRFSGRKSTVIDGPFAETKELVAGYIIIQVKSREEAIEWARRGPTVDGEVEIRRVFEDDDFAPSDPSGELREEDQQLRDRVSAQH